MNNSLSFNQSQYTPIFPSAFSKYSAFTPILSKFQQQQRALNQFQGITFSNLLQFNAQQMQNQEVQAVLSFAQLIRHNQQLQQLKGQEQVVKNQEKFMNQQQNLEQKNQNVFKKGEDIRNSEINVKKSSVLSSNNSKISDLVKDSPNKSLHSFCSHDDFESTDFSSNQKDQQITDFSEKDHKIFIDNGIVLDKVLDSEDLNECVEALLKKEKLLSSNNKCIKQIIKHKGFQILKMKDKKRRFRKNKDQNQYLMEAYQKNHIWDKMVIHQLSNELGLKESQIYKWNWDQRKKDLCPIFSFSD